MTFRERTEGAAPFILFLLTVLTTIIAGAIYESPWINETPGRILSWPPAWLLKGIPFSAALIFILLTHESGHYIASRIHKVPSTLPYFIPAPPFISPIGTFGAVIKMRAPITTRRALIDIGAAGPLAGFMAAVIVAAIGLSYSEVVEVKDAHGLALGEPFIFKAISYVIFGPLPEGADITCNSVAFAGWIGFFVTALNLLPVGQLDGGHIVYAFAGRFHRNISLVTVASLISLGLLTWAGWLVWGVLVAVIGIWHPPVEDENEPLTPARKLVAAASLAVFMLTFTPMPFYIF